MTLPLRVNEFGRPDAPDLVLLHGLTDAGTTWPDAVERWEHGWHVLAIDQRGHGESPPFHETQLERIHEVFVADAVRTLETARELSGGGTAVVIGHSLGGRVALAVAAQRPELVRALVLEDPALFWSPAEIPEFIAEQQEFLDAFDGAFHEGAAAAEVERMRRETPWSDAEILMWAACKPRVDRGLIANLDLGDVDAVAMLDAVAVPTLVVHPPASPLIPPPGAVSNPLVRFVEVAGAGHCVRRDRPQQYYAVVEAFLDEVTDEPSW